MLHLQSCPFEVQKGKGEGFPYSIPGVVPGADPGVQAVSPQVTVSHPPGGRLPLLSAKPAVTFPAAEHHRFMNLLLTYLLTYFLSYLYKIGTVPLPAIVLGFPVLRCSWFSQVHFHFSVIQLLLDYANSNR